MHQDDSDYAPIVLASWQAGWAGGRHWQRQRVGRWYLWGHRDAR